MTFPELQIQFDLNPDNRIDVLENANTCSQIDVGYLFVDQEDGQCYLFDEDGQEDDINKVTYIDDWTFGGCTSLTSIRIPDSIKSIGHSAFYNCKSLTSIEIPNSVKNIGDWTFGGCTSLKNIKIPSSVKSIKNGAFWKCKSLTSIKIPDSVKSIGKMAFTYSESLTSIKIPSSVETIGYWAFDDCTSLKEVVFEGKTMNEVKAMDDYPWRIKDKSIIKIES